MLLAVDIGNSTVFAGIISGGRVIADFRFPTNKAHKAKEHEAVIDKMLVCKGVNKSGIKDVIIVSVVPELDAAYKKLMTRMFDAHPFFAGLQSIPDIKVMVRSPREVGADRLVNACAAHHTIKGGVIVIDFGTAITFDYINKAGEFLGGVIAPGINICVEALYRNTSKLPVIELRAPEKVIGQDTSLAMQSGIFNGFAGLVTHIVSRMKDEIGEDVKVIATGGALPALRDDLKNVIDTCDYSLILKGLNEVYNHALLVG